LPEIQPLPVIRIDVLGSTAAGAATLGETRAATATGGFLVGREIGR